jgi:U6 snRNA-associated Sm-like protein LSm3
MMQAFDQHLNLVLGDAQENLTIVELDEDTHEENVQVRYFKGL